MIDEFEEFVSSVSFVTAAPPSVNTSDGQANNVFQNPSCHVRRLLLQALDKSRMKIDFSNIFSHTISISDSKQKWRFDDKNCDLIPDIHFSRIKLLDKDAANFLSNYISDTGLHANVPFKKNYFRTIDKAQIHRSHNQQEIKKWLYQRGLPFDKNVFLSWDRDTAMIVPWKILIKYYDGIFYSGLDDLTVFDESLQWALLFYHEDEIYFGTNKDFIPSDNFADLNFSW